jgi:fructoselysine-6-P-deglycase FrlB-like protein
VLALLRSSTRCRRRSPVADVAEFVVPIEAGPEVPVAATKTVVGSMAAGAELIAELADDMTLRSALDRQPERLRRALTLDWSDPMISPAHLPCSLPRAA